jgi:hypothetical protein
MDRKIRKADGAMPHLASGHEQTRVYVDRRQEPDKLTSVVALSVVVLPVVWLAPVTCHWDESVSSVLDRLEHGYTTLSIGYQGLAITSTSTTRTIPTKPNDR